LKSATLTFSLFYLFFFSAFSQDQQQEFEGIVAYEISYDSKTDSISNLDLEYYAGTYRIMYYKKGAVRRETYSKTTDILATDFYTPTEKVNYGYIFIIDSLYSGKVTERGPIKFLKKTVLTDAGTIYDTPCSSVKISVLEKTSDKKMEITYIYSPKYPMNKKWFKGYKEGFYNKALKHISGINLGVDILYEGDFLQRSRAVLVKEMELPDKLFNQDTIKESGLEFLEEFSDGF